MHNHIAVAKKTDAHLAGVSRPREVVMHVAVARRRCLWRRAAKKLIGGGLMSFLDLSKSSISSVTSPKLLKWSVNTIRVTVCTSTLARTQLTVAFAQRSSPGFLVNKRPLTTIPDSQRVHRPRRSIVSGNLKNRPVHLPPCPYRHLAVQECYSKTSLLAKEGGLMGPSSELAARARK